MHVGSTSSIMAREYRVHPDYTELVGRLDSAEEGGVEVGSVVGVAVAGGHDAGVHAGAVAVPEFYVGVRDG